MSSSPMRTHGPRHELTAIGHANLTLVIDGGRLEPNPRSHVATAGRACPGQYERRRSNLIIATHLAGGSERPPLFAVSTFSLRCEVASTRR